VLGVAGWLPRGQVRTLRLDGVAIGEVTASQDRADLRRLGGAAFEHWFAEHPPESAEIAVDGFQPVPIAPAPAAAWRPDRGPPLALFVDTRVPAPGRDAGASAALSHIAALVRLGFRVRASDPAGLDTLLAEEQGRARLAYLHRLPSMGRAGTVRALNPGVRVVFGLADLHALRARRRWAVDGTPIPPNIEAAEFRAARRADVVLTHSYVEADTLAGQGVLAYVVPWEVPRPAARAACGGAAAVALLGYFGHAPSEDAAAWLLDAVLPLLWRELPDVPVLIAGRAMPDWLRARASARVRLMPDLADLAELWAETRVAVAPLRYGAGIKGKVLDACAAGVACLCTPIAAEGLPRGLVPVAAPDAAAFARALISLLTSPAERAPYEARGRRYVADVCGAANVDQALASAIGIAAPGRLTSP
jgi:hypothetical protein